MFATPPCEAPVDFDGNAASVHESEKLGMRALITGPFWAIAVVTLVGTVVRFYRLGDQPLWLDEAITAFHVSLPWNVLWGTPLGAHPPIYYSIAKIASFFGDSEGTLRFFSAAAGSATVPIVYLIGRRCGGPYFGIAAAAALALSGIHLEYSQEARSYALVTFFFALAVLFGTSFMSQRAEGHDGTFIRRSLCLYGLFAGLSVLTHVVLIYYVFGLAAAVLMHRVATDPDFPRIRRVRLPWGFIAVNLLVAVLWAGLLVWMERTASNFSSYPDLSFQVAIGFLTEIAGSRHLTGLGPAPAIAVVLLCITGLCLLLVRRRHEALALAATLVLAVPMLVWLTGFIRPIFMDRTILPSVLGVALCIGALTMVPRRAIAIVLLTAYFAVASLSVSAYHFAFKKQDWRGAMSFIGAESVGRSAIVVCLTSAYWPVRYYSERVPETVFSLIPQSGGLLFRLNEEKLRDSLSNSTPGSMPISLLEPDRVQDSPWLDAVGQSDIMESYDRIWTIESHCSGHQRDAALDTFRARLHAAGFRPATQRIFNSPRAANVIRASLFERR